MARKTIFGIKRTHIEKENPEKCITKIFKIVLIAKSYWVVKPRKLKWAKDVAHVWERRKGGGVHTGF